MKRLLLKTWHILKGSSIIFLSLLFVPIAKLLLGKKQIWLISERPCEARDNGFNFYQYLLEKQPQIHVVYAIKKKSSDFKKIQGSSVEFGSIKHIFVFCGCKCSISSTTECLAPNSYILLFQNKFGYPHKNIFLQHGIIHTRLDFLSRKFNNIDLFICGAKPEFNEVSQNYGYPISNVVYTGLARFDNYHDLNLKNQILIMPTWRRGADDEDITTSYYFKIWSSLLNSESLANFLKNRGLSVFFYIHPVFQKYSSFFKSSSTSIIIANRDAFDVQKLLKESKILITDFSSIIFDFGYMKKPAIYYHFDTDNFFKNHYKPGYFNYENDSFGYTVYNENELIETLNKIVQSNFNFEEKFKNNHKRFFEKYDNKNCERIYNAITGLK